MVKSILISAIIIFSYSEFLFAQSTDQVLRNYLKNFNINPIENVQNTDKLKHEFGKQLFADSNLSLSGNISCQTCHDPNFATADGLPFAIGSGGIGSGHNRIQNGAIVTPRNTPTLYNKGNDSILYMFWDGRVHRNPRTGQYKTPEKALNGANPEYNFIVSKIDNLLAMQALFPIADIGEMRGREFAHLSNLEVWNRVTDKIKNLPKYQKYISADFNIADIANALAYYQKIEFHVNDTPLDDYLRGDNSALSAIEKDGALVFVEKGRCVKCHNGPLLANTMFQSVVAPQIGPGKLNSDDTGRMMSNFNSNDKYKFKAQPLRNIALSAPYFHSGAFNSLEEVIEHYNHVDDSYLNYQLLNIVNTFQNNYDFKIEHHDNDQLMSLHNSLKVGLGLSSYEKRSLLCFLSISLTQKEKQSQIDLKNCSI